MARNGQARGWAVCLDNFIVGELEATRTDAITSFLRTHEPDAMLAYHAAKMEAAKAHEYFFAYSWTDDERKTWKRMIRQGYHCARFDLAFVAPAGPSADRDPFRPPHYV